MESRYFNRIEIVDDYTIRKSSTDIHKLKAEYEWYKKNTWYPAANIIGEFSETDGLGSYCTAYIHGSPMSALFVKSADIVIRENDICNILHDIHNKLKNSPEVPHTMYDKMCIESLYKDKTLDRLREAKIDIDKNYIINDVKTPTIREIIDECIVTVNDSDIREIHGDLCLSNIIITGAVSPYAWYCIDPRGYTSDNRFTNMGDINYDVAKLAHSIIGRYDQIKADYGFMIEKVSDNEYHWCIRTTPYQSFIEDYFIREFADYNYYNIMIHLFLSMIPLHKDNPEHQEKMLVNALRLYLDKDKILQD